MKPTLPRASQDAIVTALVEAEIALSRLPETAGSKDALYTISAALTFRKAGIQDLRHSSRGLRAAERLLLEHAPDHPSLRTIRAALATIP